LVCIYKGSTMKLIGLVDTGEEAFQKSVVWAMGIWLILTISRIVTRWEV
jgi:hypothetical protein